MFWVGRPLVIRGILLCIGAGIAAFQWMSLRSLYYSGSFSFNDLALINDFLANTVYQGKPFFSSQYQLSHLSIHFTPTLWLITPFYLMFSSQLILPTVGLVAVWCGVFFQVGIWSAFVSSRAGLGESILFLLFLAANPYLRGVVATPHYECFYFLFCSATLYCLVTEKSRLLLMSAFLLMLGTRQDAGFLFVFQMLTVCILAGPQIRSKSEFKIRAWVLGLVSVAYVLIAVRFLLPHFGSNENTMISPSWDHYGSTWTQIFLTILSSPLRVLRDVFQSGIWKFNASVLGLPFLSPIAALLVNLSGILLYIAKQDHKRFLLFYNSALLLPGLFALSAWSWSRVPILTIQKNKAVLGVAGLLAVGALAWVPNSGHVNFLPNHSDLYSRFEKELGNVLSQCPEIRSVATDYRSIVFVPNRFQKLLLTRRHDADLVIVRAEIDLTLSDVSSRQSLLNELKRSAKIVEWTRAKNSDNSIYFGPHSLGIKCGMIR